MYNVNEGADPAQISEILEPLHSCVREILAKESIGGPLSIDYTDHDVIGVTLLYTSVLSNRLVHRMAKEQMSHALAKELSEHYAMLIREVTLGMSKLDTSVYYKKREQGN